MVSHCSFHSGCSWYWEGLLLLAVFGFLFFHLGFWKPRQFLSHCVPSIPALGFRVLYARVPLSFFLPRPKC